MNIMKTSRPLPPLPSPGPHSFLAPLPLVWRLGEGVKGTDCAKVAKKLYTDHTLLTAAREGRRLTKHNVCSVGDAGQERHGGFGNWNTKL